MPDPRSSAEPEGQPTLEELFVDLAGMADDASAVQDCLRQIARRVADTVEGVAYASITSDRDGSSSTVAMSSAVALAVDAAQYESEEGPCLQALHDVHPVSVPDMSADMRWPNFRRTALDLGLHSSASIPLFTASGTTAGVLNLYSHDVGGLLPLAMEIIPLFHSSLDRPRSSNWGDLVGAGGRLLVIAVRAALDVRHRIQAAVGVLMFRAGLDSHQAYFELRTQAASNGVAIPVVADRLLAPASGE
jgi:hypothetical protein